MNKGLEQLLSRLDRNAFQREVDTELRFHIEMQAEEYEREGLTPAEAAAKAAVRFGDFAQIKTECVQIGLENSMRMRAMKVVFIITFLLGVVIRSLNVEFHVTRIGDVLIMIAVFGGLLLLGKKMRAGDFGAAPEPTRLGLRNGYDSPPVAFDESGRTPFERVQSDD